MNKSKPVFVCFHYHFILGSPYLSWGIFEQCSKSVIGSVIGFNIFLQKKNKLYPYMPVAAILVI